MAKANIGRRTLVYWDGDWHEDQPTMLGLRSHAVWMSSVVFDAARVFDGVAPDLDRHCTRLNQSAHIMGLSPTLGDGEIEQICRDGIAKFSKDIPLYICPMYFAEDGFIMPDPESTRFALSIHESPLPQPDGFSAGLTRYRRPARDAAPTDAKASCLYPNVARGMRDAKARGFDFAVVEDPVGNVAEFSFTNLFMAKSGVVHTPAINGTFLNGLTRQRVIQLLRDDGVEVIERAIQFSELLDADELFATGNYSKVMPCTRIEDRTLPQGPFYKKARALYFAFARAHG